jgi:hypothetical protein
LKQATVGKKLTSLDWFGIVTGLIGLIVDVIALSAIFSLPQSKEYTFNTSLWLLAATSLIYTITVISVYARRVFCIRYRGRVRSLSIEKVAKIERGVTGIIFGIGLPIFLTYAISLALAIDKAMPPEKQSVGSAIGFAVVLGGIISWVLCTVIDQVGMWIYGALDPDYHYEIKPQTTVRETPFR